MWPINLSMGDKNGERLIRVMKMQMLRWLDEHTLRDKIRNEDIRKGLGVANFKEKMIENRMSSHIPNYSLCLICECQL